jgi:hypothetical protein
MRTPYRDGMIAPQFSKPETAMAEKLLEKLTTLSKMQPIAKRLSDAAKAATEGLTEVLKIAGCDAEEHLPLIDGQEEAV